VERNTYNTATTYGIGLYASGGSVTLTNSVFAGNRVNSHGHHGIGLYSGGTDVSIVDCVFSNNYASGTWASGGGALYVNGGTLGVTGTLFVDNSANSNLNGASETLGGGAAWLGGGVVYSFLNCAFRNNSMYFGTGNTYGGTFSVQGSTTTGTVENCTIVDSKADKYGGAIWVKAGYLNLKNCILWTNTTGDLGYDVATGGGNAIISYCNLSGDKDSTTYLLESSGTLAKGSGLQWVNPLFASDYDDLHLKSEEGRWDPSAGGGAGAFVPDGENSPCIDKGEPGGVATYTNVVPPNDSPWSPIP